MSEPLVSIITPSFNQGAFIEETILSVLNQSYRNIEFLLIDGGSTDGTHKIIKKYESHFSFLLIESDKGQADAINKGIQKSNGDFICWLNSDDLIFPEFVSTRVRQFNDKHGVDMIYGDVKQGSNIEHSWLRKGKNSSFKSMRQCLEVPIPQQSAMWRRSITEKTGLLDDKWQVLLDRDYFIRIAANHKIRYIPDCLAFFRMHENSKSIAQALLWAKELPQFYTHCIERYEEYKMHKKRVMSRCYWMCAKIYDAANQSKLANEYRKKARKENYYIFFRLNMLRILVGLKKSLKL
jgi:glycosyltransferase involved in cell wall biosynthesis